MQKLRAQGEHIDGDAIINVRFRDEEGRTTHLPSCVREFGWLFGVVTIPVFALPITQDVIVTGSAIRFKVKK